LIPLLWLICNFGLKILFCSNLIPYIFNCYNKILPSTSLSLKLWNSHFLSSPWTKRIKIILNTLPLFFFFFAEFKLSSTQLTNQNSKHPILSKIRKFQMFIFFKNLASHPTKSLNFHQNFYLWNISNYFLS